MSMGQALDMKKIYAEVNDIKKSMVTREEMNSFIETIAILSNDDTMAQINASEKDISLGNIREITDIYDF